MNNSQSEDELEKNWKELSNLLIGNWTTQTIGAAVRLGIIEALVQHPMTLENIINTLKLNKNACEHLLRALIGLKIVKFSNNTFFLTTKGEILKEDHKWSLAKPALLWSEEHYSAWEGVSESIQTGKPYFEKKYGDIYFEWLANNPEKCLAYQSALESYAEHDYRYIPKLYDFSCHTKVLDVGGGSGNLLKRILKKYPTIKGILFERPELASLAHKNLSIPGLENRYKVILGNFFDEIPKRGDIIILARVLHDWDDLRAQIILKNCFEALPRKGRLIIIELLLPPTLDSGFGALLNLNLLVMTGGKERTLDEYKHLLEDTGFEFKTIILTPSVSTIIVAKKK